MEAVIFKKCLCCLKYYKLMKPFLSFCQEHPVWIRYWSIYKCCQSYTINNSSYRPPRQQINITGLTTTITLSPQSTTNGIKKKIVQRKYFYSLTICQGIIERVSTTRSIPIENSGLSSLFKVQKSYTLNTNKLLRSNMQREYSQKQNRTYNTSNCFRPYLYRNGLCG